MSFQEYSEILFDACSSCLGEVATYLQKGGAAFEVSGVFTKEYMLIQEGSFDSSVSSADPVFEVSSRDITSRGCSPKVGDRITVRSEFYRIVEIKPNCEGQIKLTLKKGEKS